LHALLSWCAGLALLAGCAVVTRTALLSERSGESLSTDRTYASLDTLLAGLTNATSLTCAPNTNTLQKNGISGIFNQ